MKEKRILYLDALRLVGALAVVVIHLSATGYSEALPGSYEWVVCLSYNALARFAVPVFVMISGAMYLDPGRTVTMDHIFRKTGKMIAVFLAWSVTYALTESLKEHTLFSGSYFLSVAQKAVTGHYHMWYLYMIAVLYLATPFLRPIAADRKLLKRFILLAFLLNHAAFLLEMIPGWEDTFATVTESANLGIFSGFTGYYCLGYYLHTEHFTKKQTRLIELLSLLLPVAVVAGCTLQMPKLLTSQQMPHIFLYSAGVFLAFQKASEWLEQSPLLKDLIGKLAACSFGVYLVHPAFNFTLRRLGIYALTFDPLLCVPLCSLLVFAASYGTVRITKKLPLIKYLT